MREAGGGRGSPAAAGPVCAEARAQPPGGRPCLLGWRQRQGLSWKDRGALCGGSSPVGCGAPTALPRERASFNPLSLFSSDAVPLGSTFSLFGGFLLEHSLYGLNNGVDTASHDTSSFPWLGHVPFVCGVSRGLRERSDVCVWR